MSEFEKKIIELKDKIKSSLKIDEVEIIRSELFGKNGIINSEFKKIGSLSGEEKKEFAANINKVKQELLDIYKAKSVEFSSEIKDQIKIIEKAGYGKFPICIAKTQYSFSIDPKIKGAPSNHVLQIREIRLSSGAEFLVVVCGSIMTMPGLPKTPAADVIRINEKGDIDGLF